MNEPKLGYFNVAWMTELADVADLKSAALRGVQVQILLRALALRQ